MTSSSSMNPNLQAAPVQESVAENSTKFHTLDVPLDGHQQDDQDEISALSHSSPLATPSSAYWKRGTKRKKLDKRRAALERAWPKNLEALSKSLEVVPFIPGNSLDLTVHETLLKRLGLWDFAHFDFGTHLRDDLIKQLIANFSKDTRVSYVNGARIKVSRADLGRAMKLPRKEKSSSVDELKEHKESQDDIAFLEKFVSKWFLLHEDMWIMPDEVLHWMNMIKEGYIEKIDWAGILWYMVEKELHSKSDLQHCYYASHLQCLIRHQRQDLLEEGHETSMVDIEDDEGLAIEETQIVNECNIELTLGGLNTMVEHEANMLDSACEETFSIEGDVMKDEDTENLYVEKNFEDEGKDKYVNEESTMIVEDREDTIAEENSLNVEGDDELLVEGNDVYNENKENLIDGGEENFEECEENKKDISIASMMGRCNQAMDESFHHEEEKKHEERLKSLEMEELVVEEDDGEDEDNIEDEDNEEGMEDSVRLSILSQRQHFQNVCSDNMDSLQVFPSGLHISDANFLISGVDTQRYPNNSMNFVNGNKRSRSDNVWEGKSQSEIDLWVEQMHQMMQKFKAMYDSKDQACQEMAMNQQLYLSELQQRDAVIQRQKEELQKKHMEAYKMENELYMMSNLVEGYRKALKSVQNSFAEYRSKYHLVQESIYKDTGCGGLVLSKMELERQRLRRVEEEKQLSMLLEAQIRMFETEFVSGFKDWDDRVELLGKKLAFLHDECYTMKEFLGKRVASNSLEVKECRG